MTFPVNQTLPSRRDYCVWHWLEEHPHCIPPIHIDTICEECENIQLAQVAQRRENRRICNQGSNRPTTAIEIISDGV